MILTFHSSSYTIHLLAITLSDIEEHYNKIHKIIGNNELKHILYGKPMDNDTHDNLMKEFFSINGYLVAVEKISNSKDVDFATKEAGNRWLNKFLINKIETNKEIKEYENHINKFEEDTRFQILDEEIEIRKLYSYYYNQDPRKPDRNKVAIKLMENHFKEMTNHRMKLHRMKRDFASSNGIDYLTMFSLRTL